MPFGQTGATPSRASLTAIDLLSGRVSIRGIERGRRGARVAQVPSAEQNIQDGQLSSFYQANPSYSSEGA
jgi:hypothetical protein